MFPDNYLENYELFDFKNQRNKHGHIFGLAFWYRRKHIPENTHDRREYDYAKYIIDLDNPDRDLLVIETKYGSQHIFREDT